MRRTAGLVGIWGFLDYRVDPALREWRGWGLEGGIHEREANV
jgi:hypothetical protein